MKDSLLCFDAVANTLNLEISHCQLADYIKESYLSVCHTCSMIIFPQSTSKIIACSLSSSHLCCHPCLSSLMTQDCSWFDYSCTSIHFPVLLGKYKSSSQSHQSPVHFDNPAAIVNLISYLQFMHTIHIQLFFLHPASFCHRNISTHKRQWIVTNTSGFITPLPRILKWHHKLKHCLSHDFFRLCDTIAYKLHSQQQQSSKLTMWDITDSNTTKVPDIATISN